MAAMQWLRRGLDLSVDQDDDPRVGSGREDSSGGGTLSASSGSKTSSLSQLGGTFIPVAVILGVCLTLFIVCRPRFKRVYAPRTIPGLRYPEHPTPPLPSGWFNWIIPFLGTPDDFVLHHGSIDGFFFLRYIKVLAIICGVGCCITWPILLPINSTGGNKQTDLDSLTLGNVKNKSVFFAHALVAWAFFGFVLAMIVRECVFYVNIRQAYLSSPAYSERLSSRTLLITGVPPHYRDEARLRKLYGDSARRIWVPRSNKTLANLVKEREQTARRLEKAEIDLIVKANAMRGKQIRLKKAEDTPNNTTHQVQEAGVEARADSIDPISQTATVTTEVGTMETLDVFVDADMPQENEKDVSNEADGMPLPRSSTGTGSSSPVEGAETSANIIQDTQDDRQRPRTDTVDDYSHPYGLEHDLPDVRGSVAAKWVPAEHRPYHRPLSNFGRRVDTIRWGRDRLKALNKQIYQLRKRVRRGDSAALPAIFIEFDTQEAAQAAHQVVAHHRPLQMSTRLLGIRPEEVIWGAMRMTWWELIIRKTAVLAFIAALIIFWSIPAALIGIVSNISFLASLPFLTWLNLLPAPILSFLQSFVPAMALSLLMSLVPIILRVLAAQAGAPSFVIAELFTQSAYFAFQVVQVFLITTLTSAASSTLTDILQDPLSATDLLAQNLPRASNFYLSYILVQCLAAGGLNLLHVLEFFRQLVIPRLSKFPRTRLSVWTRLRVIGWGGVFPVYSNMGVIALSYACIAPLVLGFACVGMLFTGIVWKYNLTYCFESKMDSKGLFYPQALLHLLIGLYMALVCLIGLFALKLAFGPMVMMIIFLLFTVLVHFSLSDAIAPLLLNLPQTLAVEEEIQQELAVKPVQRPADSGAAANYYDEDQTFGEEYYDDSNEDDESEEHGPITSDRAVEGASGMRAAVSEWLKDSFKAKAGQEMETSGVTDILRRLNLVHEEGEPPGFLSRWLHPDDFVSIRKQIPQDLSISERAPDNAFFDYLPPELWLPRPTIWIPKDEARVSRQEIAHTRRLVPISDAGASLNERARLVVNLEEAPLTRADLVRANLLR